MRHQLFTIIFFLAAMTFLHAQTERLYNLRNNAQLLERAQKMSINVAQQSSRSVHRGKRRIQQPDTIQNLPFRDDFVRDNMPSLVYWENFGIEGYWTSTCQPDSNFADTVYYAMNDTAWEYTYNANTNTVDSVPKDQISLLFYDDTTDCSTLVNIDYAWPAYYRYTFNNNGTRIDSQLLNTNDTLYGDPAIVGQNDPSSLYLDNYAYRNDDYTSDQPTVGVVTLNGLNEVGRPHNWLGGPNYGPADTLTSKPINLNGFTSGDNLAFSFYWQPQGLGDYPNQKDSIFLEFKDAFGEWQTIWKRGGYEGEINNPSFQYEFISLDQPVYFHNSFQFRFRNYASIMGNNDHWHLDYIFLNNNRTQDSTFFRDMAISESSSTLLKNYQAMPWRQFKDNQTEELNEQVAFTFHNLTPDVENTAIPFSKKVLNGFTDNVIYEPASSFQFQISPQQKKNIGQISNVDIDETSNYTPFDDSLAKGDSALIKIASLVQYSADDYNDNDSIVREYPFYNYYAYDDGTAEKAYGVEGPGNKKIAYEFVLNKPDTLRAIYIHFTQIDHSAGDQQFNLFVWDDINKNNNDNITDDTLTYLPFNGVRYPYQENGFLTYKLEEPLIISDTFYVGITQDSEENIQIGYDRNNDAKERTYYYASQTWNRSVLEGALMIRPVVGKDVQLPTSIETEQQVTKTKPSFHIYPNPASDFMQIDVNKRREYRVEVFDNHGVLRKKLQINDHKTLTINDLSSGMYFLRLFDKEHGTARVKKFVKM